MGLGPVRDGETTFLRLDGVPGWAGIPDLDESGPTVLAAYFRTYGPTTPERIHDWFGKGLGAKRHAITRWLGRLDAQCEQVAIDGESWCSGRTSTSCGRRALPPPYDCCRAATPG